MTDRPLTVGEATRLVEPAVGRPVHPRELTRLLYDKQVPSDLAPVVAGRRMIDRSLLPEIVAALLKKRKHLRRQEAGSV